MSWPLITNLAGTFPGAKVMCDTCQDWIPLTRRATPAEVLRGERIRKPRKSKHDPLPTDEPMF